MKAAIVTSAGRTPVYGDFEDPAPRTGEELITVTASALSRVTRSRASASHYSSSRVFPAVAGVDGVGRTSDGRRVYFALPDAPFGGMAEKVVVRQHHCVALPDDVDDVTAAAIANPGMSALRERAHLVAGETVLINGATGSAGRVAVQIAKYMGAKKVIATGRNAETLKQVKALGADVAIPLSRSREELEAAFQEEIGGEGVDVVIDYLWGHSAQALIVAIAKSAQDGVPIRYVQVGSASGEEIALPAAALRAKTLALMGSGIGSVSLRGLLGAVGGVLQAVVPGQLKIETEAVPLADVEEAWNRDSGQSRIVFVVRQHSRPTV